jgi:AmmeMemoRadiSam system protein B
MAALPPRRPPACAGRFYEGTAERLQAQVQALLEPDAPRLPARAVVCPHAGLMYSGAVAGAVYSRITIPSTVILVGPNHTGYGPPLSVYSEGEWLLPGGAVPIAADLARALLARCPRAQSDHLAHQYEHCLEVQLPFLRALRPDIQILPIVVGFRDLEACRTLGLALAAIIEEAPTPPLLIASTDLTHCGPGFGQSPPSGLTAEAFAHRQDRLALDAVQTLDGERLHRTVEEHQITMCGYVPSTAVLFAAKALGAGKASVVRYATSADVSGDVDRVVGYGGAILT